MKISKINFNLLEVLNFLLTERNVTMAGQRLGLSQSATSCALKQLREIYKDELLVRGQEGAMVLTPLAKSLVFPVRKALSQIDIALSSNQEFSPENCTATFKIGMNDYEAAVLLPHLLSQLNKKAPNISVTIYNLNFLKELDDFEASGLDLLLGSQDSATFELAHQKLYEDEILCAMDKNHPLAKKERVTREDFLQYPQALASMSVDNIPEDNYIEKLIRKHHCFANVSLVVPYSLVALETVMGTEFVCLTSQKLLSSMGKKYGLVGKKVPFEAAPYVAYQYWHASNEGDKAHQWLRKQVVKAAKKL